MLQIYLIREKKEDSILDVLSLIWCYRTQTSRNTLSVATRQSAVLPEKPSQWKSATGTLSVSFLVKTSPFRVTKAIWCVRLPSKGPVPSSAARWSAMPMVSVSTANACALRATLATLVRRWLRWGSRVAKFRQFSLPTTTKTVFLGVIEVNSGNVNLASKGVHFATQMGAMFALVKNCQMLMDTAID